MPAHQAVNNQQLKMFMTPKEIVSQYQPLDGDRQDHYEEPTAMGTTYRAETDNEVWQRKSSEAQLSPRDYFEAREGESFQTPAFDVEGVMDRTSYPRMSASNPSTSAWEEHEYREGSYLERKHQEHLDSWDRRMGQQSLWGAVRQGGVQTPVHLGQQFGSSDKPQVVGGHHRIASALDTRPNDLLPVIHHESIHSARPLDPAEEAHRGKTLSPQRRMENEHAKKVQKAGFTYT